MLEFADSEVGKYIRFQSSTRQCHMIVYWTGPVFQIHFDIFPNFEQNFDFPKIGFELQYILVHPVSLYIWQFSVVNQAG